MYVNHFNSKNFLTGGCGRKVKILLWKQIVLLVKGEVDMMAYVGSATSKWDSCAGESIVKAMGGYFTTPHGNQISYDPN